MANLDCGQLSNQKRNWVDFRDQYFNQIYTLYRQSIIRYNIEISAVIFCVKTASLKQNENDLDQGTPASKTLP